MQVNKIIMLSQRYKYAHACVLIKICNLRIDTPTMPENLSKRDVKPGISFGTIQSDVIYCKKGAWLGRVKR